MNYNSLNLHNYVRINKVEYRNQFVCHLSTSLRQLPSDPTKGGGDSSVNPWFIWSSTSLAPRNNTDQICLSSTCVCERTYNTNNIKVHMISKDEKIISYRANSVKKIISHLHYHPDKNRFLLKLGRHITWN